MSSQQKDWTDDELQASVEEYLKLRDAQINGEKPNKSEIYRSLSERFGRSPGAFERRFGNISFVLAEHGREWVKGHKPLKNVGDKNFNRIRDMLFKQRPGFLNSPAYFSAQAPPASPPKSPPKGNERPKYKTASATQYDRDQAVVKWVLHNADGRCEACDSPAPFYKASNGEPFLEVHHLIRLCDGGPDTIENAIAVCPNCHRNLHYGKDLQRIKETIYRKLNRLKP
jgi:5-methylcytosine-specific restriction protein A